MELLPLAPPKGFPLRPVNPKRFCKLSEYKIRNQVVFQCSQLLLERKRDIETAEQILRLIHPGGINTYFATTTPVKSFVREYAISQADKDESDSTDWFPFLGRNFIDLESLRRSMGLRESIDELRRLEMYRRADKVFLEAVVRVSNMPSEETSQNYLPQKFIAIGVLIKGMAFGNLPEQDWFVLGKHNNLEALDTVLQGMISVLSVDSKRLSAEAHQMLKDLERFFSYDLDSIKKVLGSNQSPEDCIQSLERLQELYKDKAASRSLFHQIENVPARTNWQLAERLNLSPESLVRAIQHPSQSIWQNAGSLIKHGAGGDEAIELAKNLVGDSEWEAFVSSAP